jgi:hypothetical protein
MKTMLIKCDICKTEMTPEEKDENYFLGVYVMVDKKPKCKSYGDICTSCATKISNIITEEGRLDAILNNLD